MADFNVNFDRNAQNFQRDLVLATNEFCFLQSKTNGVIKTYAGPITMTISAQEALVSFNPKTKQFVENNNFEKAKQLFVSAPEGWYISLKNPAPDNGHPECGKASPSPELMVGRKIHICGPTTFPLYPGQMAKVIKGHSLRTNQYLLARVYDAEAAQNASATIVDAEGNKTEVKESYFAGQLLVIKGTEVSFYIPPTGIEVLPCDENPNEFIREAVTLERLEYCILKDENGSKSYYHGPAVVFPKPTETFVQTPQKTVIFRAIELSDISGIYLKVIAEYTDDKNVVHPIGEELFLTGKDQKIYYPRPEHAMIQYDGKYMHHAIAIPKGEGRYILNRLTGDVKTIIGPAMYLPDPRTEVVVKRILTAAECELFYPGNHEALAYNLGLTEAQMEKDSRMGKTNKTDVINNAYSTSNQEKTLAIFAANANISRGTSYTKPRTIVLDTKYEGVVTVSPWTGFAVNVVSKSGKRETIVGPATRMLDYDETLEMVNLSTGKPKSTDKLISTAYLRVDNNKVSDIIVVQTKDYVDVALKVSYNVNFLREYKDKWFSVDNYVKFLCDAMRAELKAAAKKYGIEEFYSKTAEIVKGIVLDEGAERGEGAPKGRVFKANGMCVTDVELLGVEVEASVARLLDKHQKEMISKMLELSDAERKAEMTKQLAEFERAEAELAHQNKMYNLELAQKAAVTDADNRAQIAMLKRAEEQAATEAKKALQPVLDAIHTAQLQRDRAADDEKIKTENELAKIEMTKQKAYADTVKQMFEAISPDLVAALESQANANIMGGIGEAIAPYALANGESASQAITRLLKGTTLEETLAKLGTFKTN